MRIAVDHDKCIASGACALTAPEVFGQDEDGIVVVLAEHPPPSLHERALDAVRACPAAVIWTEPANGGSAG
jgi:ferredoxin